MKFALRTQRLCPAVFFDVSLTVWFQTSAPARKAPRLESLTVTRPHVSHVRLLSVFTKLLSSLIFDFLFPMQSQCWIHLLSIANTRAAIPAPDHHFLRVRIPGVYSAF